MGKNNRAGKYINSRLADFGLDSDSSDRDQYSDSESDHNSYSVRLWFNLCFVMAQNYPNG